MLLFIKRRAQCNTSYIVVIRFAFQFTAVSYQLICVPLKLWTLKKKEVFSSLKSSLFQNLENDSPFCGGFGLFQKMNCVVANCIARHFGGHSSMKLIGKIDLPRTSASFTCIELNSNKKALNMQDKNQLVVPWKINLHML